MLDIGCGSGVTLRLLRGAGWEAIGQELDSAAADQARRYSGCKVHVGAVEDLVAEAESFDAITMSHVIEHVTDPVGLLRACRRLLKPGGRVVAVTPNIDSLGHHVYAMDWRGLEPPRHLQLFSLAALRRSAAEADLFVDRIFTTSAFSAYFSLASQEVRARRLLQGVHRRQWVRAMRFKIASTLLECSTAGLGEELVLIAVRESGTAFRR
jgi:SAM-dependent methyltransferase